MRDIDDTRAADLWDFFPGDDNDSEWFDWWISRRIASDAIAAESDSESESEPSGFWGEAETWTSAKRKRPIIG